MTLEANPQVEVGRAWCPRCRRPKAVCWCGQVRPIDSQTRVVFLQHPREARVPVSTCRMAHLSLPNSELHIGLGAEGNARLEAIARAPGTAVLFPGEGAVEVGQLAQPPTALVVVDGTWSTARKLVERSALLRALPRVALNPDKPGNYRIRREPAEHCLATIEAVAQVLEKLERAPGRFTPMLAAFDRMVEMQLGHVQSGEGESRHARLRQRNSPRRDFARPLKDAADRLVLVSAEANGWPVEARVPGLAELIQWLALKPSSGTRWNALIAPRRPLAPQVSAHLGVTEQQVLAGDTVQRFLEQWREFRKDHVLVTWGRYTRDLLEMEGESPGEFLDLKHLSSQVLFRSSGGVEQLAAKLGAPMAQEARAVRRLNAMAAVSRALISGELQSKLRGTTAHLSP